MNKEEVGARIYAFLLFNLYSFFLICAFQENTAYIFNKDYELAKNLGIEPNLMGWGDHYVWRLLSSLLVTGCAAFLCGAVVKAHGALTALISNIPSIMFWSWMIYWLAFTDTTHESKNAYLVISFIAIASTTYLAYGLGNLGEKIQMEFPVGTVFGIKSYHWIWAIIPIYIYMKLGIISDVVRFIRFSFQADQMSILVGIMNLLFLIPIFIWVYPLYLVYKILAGESLVDKSSLIRGLANFGILIFGFLIAGAFDMAEHWMLKKVFS